jgi:predicted alpha/beta hydrolase family esterase
MTKPQLCIIHGGTTFENDAKYRLSLEAFTPSYERLLYGTDWKVWLVNQLPDYDVLLPSMPNKQNAKYDEWSLYFSKIIPFFSPCTVLIGHSLGGIFLAKYFSELSPDEKFKKIILIAAPFADETLESLGDFKISSANKLQLAAQELHLLYSEDDPVVPYSELDAYRDDLPQAHVHTFNNKQHFNDQEFPEILEIIRG